MAAATDASNASVLSMMIFACDPGPLEFARRLKTVEPGHADVEDGDVWIQPERRVQRLLPVGDRCDDIDVRREKRGRLGQHARMIVGQKNPRPTFSVPRS